MEKYDWFFFNQPGLNNFSMKVDIYIRGQIDILNL